ncbi:lysozyme inhibitor LprI family protein [Rhodanobacter sp. C01]|uniref:lysozyme inhibitor LprI family protein n=1 Tax=Rhodanobacter sp. C01 TaxID=1945856 RepID=UPI00098583CB|nr:lysozyme inhibitor LprI family protein [Rhodanobacter sp. C01]OOG47688.1 hypothetical protein B0E50_09460 [Rhodanobacter sp. C01]
MNVAKGTLWAPLIAAVALCLHGCSRPVLDYRNVQIVNGKIFAGDADKPFSGTVTNFPDNELLAPQRGFNAFAYAITHVNTAPATAVTQNLGFGAAMMFSQTSSYCTVVVDDGLPDGAAKCAPANSDVSGTEMKFSKGALDGDITYFNFDHSQYPISEGSFDGGRPNGKQKIYSMKTGKLVHTLNWDDGAVSGTEEGYDEQTDKLIVRANNEKGRLDGDVDSYDGQTGEHTYHGQYVDGKPDGMHQWWDASGKLTEQRLFKDGVLVREVSPNVAQVDTPATPPTNNAAAETPTTQAAAATPPPLPAPPSTVAIAAPAQSVAPPVVTPASTNVGNAGEVSPTKVAHTYQPGFDCAKAQSAAELTICADPLLSALDSDVAAQYHALAQQADPSQKSALLSTQREYIGARSICGSDRACVERQTRSRLHDLRQQAARTPGVLIATLKSDHLSEP